MKLLSITIFLLSNLFVSGTVFNIDNISEQLSNTIKTNLRNDVSAILEKPQNDLIDKVEQSDVSTTTQYYDIEDKNNEYINDDYKENIINIDDINSEDYKNDPKKIYNDEDNGSDSYDTDENDDDYDETDDSDEIYDNEEYSGETDDSNNESSAIKNEKLNQVIDILFSIGLELDDVKKSIDKSKIKEASSIIENTIKKQLEKKEDSLASTTPKTRFLHNAVDNAIGKDQSNNEYLVKYLTVINKFNKFSLLFASVSISILIFFTLVGIFFNKKKVENCDKVHVYEKI